MEEKRLRLWELILGSMEAFKWMYMGLIVGFLMALNILSRRNSKEPLIWLVVGMLPSLLLNLHHLYDCGVDILRDSGGIHVFRVHGGATSRSSCVATWISSSTF